MLEITRELAIEGCDGHWDDDEVVTEVRWAEDIDQAVEVELCYRDHCTSEYFFLPEHPLRVKGRVRNAAERLIVGAHNPAPLFLGPGDFED